MRILVSGLLLLAILTAAGTAVLVKGFLDSERTTQIETPTEREVVATKEIIRPRQPGRRPPARGRPGGPMKPKKGKGSYNRQNDKFKTS